MLQALFLFIKLAIPVSIAVWISNRPGEVSLLWNGWRVDTSLGFVLAVIVFVIILGFLILELLKKINNLPENMREMRDSQRKIRGYHALTRTLVALGEGNEKIALRMANRARKLLNNDPVSTVLAAQAASLSGNQETAMHFFQKLTDSPKTAFLGWRGLMQNARHHKAFEQALLYGEKARTLQNQAPLLLKEMFEIQSEAGQEKDALKTLKQLRQLNVIDVEEYKNLHSTLHLNLAQALVKHGNFNEALKHAEDAFKSMPTSSLPLYAELLEKKGKKQQAIKIIEKNWREAASPALGKIYCDLHDARAPLEHAHAYEKLAANDFSNAQSVLLYSAALIEASIWGSARQMLKRYEEMHGLSDEFCTLMAQIERKENGDSKKAQEWMRKIPTSKTL